MATRTWVWGSAPSEFITPIISFVTTGFANTAYPAPIRIAFGTVPEAGQTVYGFVDGAATGSVSITSDWIETGEYSGLSNALFGTIPDNSSVDIAVKHGGSAISNTLVATRDSTPPVLENADAASINDVSGDLYVDTTEDDGTVYWAVYEDGSTPSDADILAGTGAAAHAAVANTGTGTQHYIASGLDASQAYDVYFIHVDLAGNLSDRATATFTTSAQVWALKDTKIGYLAGPVGNESLTITIDTSDANLVTVFANENVSGGMGMGFTATGSDSYTNNENIQCDSATFHRMFYKISPTQSGSYQLVFAKAQASQILGIVVQSWKKISGAPTFDKDASVQSSSNVNSLSLAVTPAHNNSLVLSSMGILPTDGNNITKPVGYTLGGVQPGVASGTYGIASAWLAQVTAATTTPEWFRNDAPSIQSVINGVFY